MASLGESPLSPRRRSTKKVCSRIRVWGPGFVLAGSTRATAAPSRQRSRARSLRAAKPERASTLQQVRAGDEVMQSIGVENQRWLGPHSRARHPQRRPLGANSRGRLHQAKRAAPLNVPCRLRQHDLGITRSCPFYGTSKLAVRSLTRFGPGVRVRRDPRQTPSCRALSSPTPCASNFRLSKYSTSTSCRLSGKPGERDIPSR